MKQLNQKLENDFENMDEINKMNNHIADLDDLKDINKRQGMFFLKEID